MPGHDDRADLRDTVVPPGYVALFDVPTKRGVAPLVLLGAAGAFVVETVDWEGRFYRVDGRLMFQGAEAGRLTHQLLRRALEVKRHLLQAGVDIHVEGLLVAARGVLHRSPIEFDYVTTLRPEHLISFVLGRDPRHSVHEIALAQAVLEGSIVRIARAAEA